MRIRFPEVFLTKWLQRKNFHAPYFVPFNALMVHTHHKTLLYSKHFLALWHSKHFCFKDWFILGSKNRMITFRGEFMVLNQWRIVFLMGCLDSPCWLWYEWQNVGWVSKWGKGWYTLYQLWKFWKLVCFSHYGCKNHFYLLGNALFWYFNKNYETFKYIMDSIHFRLIHHRCTDKIPLRSHTFVTCKWIH